MKNEHEFSRRRQVWLLLLLISFLTLNSPLYGQYVHTSGTQILDENGDEIYFSGMNLGNWLLWEGYLMMDDFNFRTHTQFFNSVKDAFGGDLGQAIEFEHQWRMNYVTAQGIADLKGLGYNAVRVPFHFNLFWDYGTYAPTDRGFQYLDRVIDFCRANDMYVLLDMHAAPGYQNPGDHSDNVNSNASHPRNTVTFWDGDNVNIASAVWRHIADYYKNESVVWGYDLINEPVPQDGREYELLPSLITMRNAIREVDNNHIIVAEGSWWSSDLTKIDWSDPATQSATGITSQWDNNLVYQLHHYSDNYEGDESILDSRAAIVSNLNIPLIMGEYGESDDSGMEAMTDWCMNNNVDYFPWSFKKMSKDRCLWTIETNGPYEELKAFINNGTTPSSSLYNDMIAFAQNNIANGSSPALTFHQGWYDATKPAFVPDPTKAYYIDCPAHNLRLASNGSSEEAYTTSISTTGDDVAWKFVDKGNGYWHLDRATGGSLPRLRSDNSQFADMQSTGSSGGYTYYEVTPGENFGTYFLTLPNGPSNYKRLQIDNSGVVKMTSAASAGTWESFTFTEIDESTAGFVPDPAKTYYIDCLAHNLRLASNGSSEVAYTTSTTTTGDDVRWKFVAKGNGYWHLDRAAGGSKPRLRTDNSQFADMQSTGSKGIYTYYDFEQGETSGTYFLTLPDGPSSYKRLQIDNSGVVKMTSEASTGTWESFTIIETGVSARLSNNEEFAELGDHTSEVSVYPNPVLDRQVVVNTGEGSFGTAIGLTVIDIMGKWVYKTTLREGVNHISLPSSINSGLYIMSISDGTIVKNSRVMIQ